MAYASAEAKKEITPAVKAVLKKYGVKGSLSRDGGCMVLKIREGALDLIGASNAACEYEVVGHTSIGGGKSYRNAGYDLEADFAEEIIAAMKRPSWFDKSDIMTDYFHVDYYVRIYVGRWDKPYVLVA